MDENRLPLNTNFYREGMCQVVAWLSHLVSRVSGLPRHHLRVDIEKLIQSLIIYEMKSDSSVPASRLALRLEICPEFPAWSGEI